MSIRQQDDYELFAHIGACWLSVIDTIRELDRRGLSVGLQLDGRCTMDKKTPSGPADAT